MGITRTGAVPRQGYTVCTSGTHPANPSVGDSLFETDTGAALFYVGATDGWQMEWNMPWGLIAAPAAVTANQASITAQADLTGLTATYTAVANRKIRVAVIGQYQLTAAGSTDVWQSTIFKDGSQIQSFSQPVILGSRDSGFQVVAYDSPTAGSHTYKARGGRGATGLGTYQMSASAAVPATIIVEDLGPNGNPS